MIRIKNILICGLVLSFFIAGCGQNQEPPDYAETKDSAIEKGSSLAEEASKTMQQAKQEVSQIKESIIKQGDEMAPKKSEVAPTGSIITEQVKTETESKKDKTILIIKELIAKAKALLNQGKFKEAITSAQEVLNNHDSDSTEAKDIITKAKEKLKAIATEKIEDLKGGVTDKLKGFGQ